MGFIRHRYLDIPLKDIIRFLDKVEVDDNECWIFQGAKNRDGYGKYSFKGMTNAAHRFCFEIFHHKIKDKYIICHSCDVPACVNPDHLFLCTHSDNLKDSYEKERRKVSEEFLKHRLDPKEQRVLDDEQARDVKIALRDRRMNSKSISQIARDFDVSRTVIEQIKKGNTYKDIEI